MADSNMTAYPSVLILGQIVTIGQNSFKNYPGQ